MKKFLSLAASIVAVFALTTQVFAADYYYSFDGDTGSATVTGDRADNTGGNITYTDGKVGEAAVFDGATGLKLGDNLITGDTYSVALWLHPTAVTQFTTTFFGGVSATNWLSLVPYGPTANAYGVWLGENWSDNFDTTPLNENEWVHCAFVVEGTKMTVYRNGNVVFTNDAIPTGTFDGDHSVYFGVNFWDLPYQGYADELYIYNSAITADDINALMNATAATTEEATETTEEAAETVEATEASEVSTKGNADTGAEDVAVVIAVAAVAGAALVISKKKRA